MKRRSEYGRWAITILLLQASFSLFAQNVTLLKDINSSANNYGSYPSYVTSLGTSVVFSAQDPITGTELWVSNGTAAGTTQLKDILQGGGSGSPSNLVKIGSVIYFTANDGVNGNELWKTDGTTAGTVLVKDINPGSAGSYPSGFTLFNGFVYFGAEDPVNGTELWKTDGTTAGTTLAADIAPGTTDSYPAGFTAIGSSYLVFSAYTVANGQELYLFTPTGYTLVDIQSGTSSSYPDDFELNGTKVFFTASNSTYGNELWTTSGTSATTLVVDLVNGTGSSNPQSLTSSGSTVYFEAYDATYGYELWKSTSVSTIRVQDFNLNSASSYPSNLTASGSGGLFFTATDGTSTALRYTSGSTITTPSGGPINANELISYGSGSIYFQAYDATNGYELWKSTTTVASLVANIAAGSLSSYPSYLGFTGTLFFSADDNIHGEELWLSDGTTTVMVKDINLATNSNPNGFVSTASGFLFSANDGVKGTELWKTDLIGTNTLNVADINAGAGSSSPTYLGKLGSTYFFKAYDPLYGYELYKTDGVSGATLVMDISSGVGSSYPSYGAVLSGFLYFSATHPSYGYELWRTDGTTTTLVKDIYSGTGSSNPLYLTVVGSQLFFRATNGIDGYELFVSNGTDAGTSQVRNINSASSSSPSNLIDLGGALFFTASDGVNGTELWKSDGTFAGTSSIDINPTGSSVPQYLTIFNSILYFSANNGTNGYELWKSDGTLSGTLMVKDIEPATGSSSYPTYITAAGSNLYFRSYTLTNGYELWKSDGTTAGTSLVKDILSGIASSSPTDFSNINGTLYFSATDATGNVFYKTNGSASGTIKATSTGLGYDNPYLFAYYYNGKILFSANTNTYGNEPLLILAEPLNQPSALNFTGRTATSITASFTAAAGAPSGYIVLQQSGSSPTDLPVDGAPYSVGATIGTSTVAAIGSGTSFTDNFTSSTSPAAKYYAIYSYAYDAIAGVNIYKPHSPLQGNSTPLATEPTGQATGFSVTSATTTSYTVSYSAASGAPAGYIVLRKSGASAPTEIPVDGTTYTAGGTISTSTVAYVGSAITFSQSGFSAGQNYSYSVFAYNGSATTINYYTVSPLTGTATTIVAEPTSQPSSLIFSSATISTVNGSFTAASPVPAGYIVIRNTTSSVAAPVDGVAYTAGATIGSSVVVTTGTGTTLADASLASGTIYYYAVYAYNGSASAINYNTTSPLTGNKSTLFAEPASQPTALIFSSPAATSYTVSFTAAAGSPGLYIALRVAGSSAPADVPVDGTSYTVGNSIGSSAVAYVGSAVTFNEAGLTAAANYSYAVFAANGTSGTYNYRTTSPLTGTTTTLATEPTAQPSSLIFSSATTSAINGSFTAASLVPAGYIVIRNTTSSVAAPVDGVAYTAGATIGSSVVVTTGTGITLADASLTTGTIYYYAVYAYNGSASAINYNTTSPLTGNKSTLFAEPASQPTALIFSSPAATSYTVSFTAAAGSPGLYIALRVTGLSAPADVPADGISYTVGNSIGSSAVAYVGSAVTFNETGLTAAANYSYAVFAANGAAGTYNYRTTSPLTGTTTTLAAEPTAQPSSLIFSSATTSAINGSFTAASSVPAGYIIIRNTSSSVAVPVDGIAYSAGATIGSSVVVTIGTGTTLADASLITETAYYYAVYAYNGSASTINYYTASPLTGNAATMASEPTSQPSGFTYSASTSTSYTVSFTAAAGSPALYIALRIAGSSAPTEVPTDGSSYTVGALVGSSTIAYIGSANAFNETGLSAGATYSYALFAANGSGSSSNYLTSSPLTGTATTLAAEPGTQPTSLTFNTVTANSINGSFTAATSVPSGYLVLRSNSATVDSPADGVSYSAGTIIGSSAVVSNGVSTSFSDAGLSAATTYFYQVFSYNGSNTKSNYLTTAPLTASKSTLAAEPGAQPTAVIISNLGITTLTVSFTTSASSAVSGYVVIRNATTLPSGIPVDGITYAVGSATGNGTGTIVYSGSGSSFNDTGLSSSTKYHYVVYAYNDASGPINYLTVSPPTNNATTLTADTTPPVVVNTTSATVASGFATKFTANITDGESGVTTVSVQYRSISGSTTFNPIPMTSTTTNTWESASIPFAEIGEVGLEFKITATNGQGIANVPASLKTMVSFADQNLAYSAFGSQQINYRIISIPLNLDNKTVGDIFVDNLGTYDNTEWRMFKFENNTNTELTASSIIDIGKGYWFIAKTQKAINTGSGKAVSVTADQPFSINLVSGWNMIGNPYLFNLSWPEVLAASGNISLNLRTYDGAFKNGNVLNKFEGAFVFANQATPLVFPTTKNATVNGRVAKGNEPLKNAIDSPDWEVNFVLQNGPILNELSGLGMRSAAMNDYDRFDDFTLPRLFEYLEVNHQKSFLKTSYSKDIVPTSENHVWEFSVDSNLDGETEIRWDNSYFGNNLKEMALLDIATQAIIDMKVQNSIKFRSDLKRKFKVIFGDKNFVRENSLPYTLMIGTVYPNPSSSFVNIGFTTPNYSGQANVSVKLNTVMGQSVYNLYSGFLSPGYYELTWDTTDSSGIRVTPGVYLVEVIVNKQTRVEKVVIK